MNAVRIRQAVLDEIVAHARAEAPDECCGLLIGTADLIDGSARARNLSQQRRSRYLIDPRDHFSAIRLARASGRDVVGAYHSHPGGSPVPSPTDLAEAVYRAFLYLIVGADGPSPEIRAYRLGEGNFEAVTLVPPA